MKFIARAGGLAVAIEAYGLKNGVARAAKPDSKDPWGRVPVLGNGWFCWPVAGGAPEFLGATLP